MCIPIWPYNTAPLPNTIMLIRRKTKCKLCIIYRNVILTGWRTLLFQWSVVVFTIQNEFLSVDKIDYDFGILEEPETKPEKPDRAESPTIRRQTGDHQWFPMVDRSTKPKLSKTPRAKPPPSNGEILSVRNKLDSTDATKLEKVINTDVGSQDSGSGTSSVTAPSRPDASLKPAVVATGGATVGSQEAEFNDFEGRNRKAIEEHEARLAQVKTEEENIARLQKMKQSEANATADLMRRKRAIEGEIRQLEEEEERR